MNPLYPFRQHRMELSCGHRMHYVDEGEGPTLLMLHGNPTWSFFYRRLVIGLRDRYRCVVPDHVGCGLSDKPTDWNYEIRGHAENIIELVTRLDLHQITLIVHDWGGAIGYLASLRDPARFRRFITFNTAVELLALPRLLTVLRSRVFGSLVIRGLNGMVRAGLWTTEGNGHLDREVRAGYLAPYDSWANRIALHRFVQEIPLEENHPNRELLRLLASELGRYVHHPHLVFWGLKDPVFRSEYLAAWRRMFPEAEVHAFEDASHWVVEEAHDRILPLTERFLHHTDAALADR